MTRAEEAALKAYPNVEQPVWDESYPKTLFVRHTERNAFIKGYEQAEKDLALTVAQVVKLDNIIMNMVAEGYNDGYKTRPFYEEVLKRFNE